MRRLQGGTTIVQHPVVGELRLHRDKVPIDDLTLVLYYADAHSDTADKLAVLASLAAGSDPASRSGRRTASDTTPVGER